MRENGYLSLDGENLVLLSDGQEVVRLPFSNIENIVCMNYLGCSPALMGKCTEEKVGLCFVSPSGRFLARVTGETKGNVFLRREQLKRFESEDERSVLIRSSITAKVKNTRNLLLRSRRDRAEIDDDGAITHTLALLAENLEKVKEETDIETLRGLEGESAKAYFYVFNLLISQQKSDFIFCERTKRPPLDRVNAMLSFLYTLGTHDVASALECVGLDPYIGFFHTLRPGRLSLACDIIEEFRAFIERFVLTLINLKIVQAGDFEKQISGAVLLNEDGRKKVLTAWQNKKKETCMHPYLKEKIPIGLFPYAQANLLAKYVRGEISAYPCLIWE
jgi:CRISPR-associated protein Cas1